MYATNQGMSACLIPLKDMEWERTLAEMECNSPNMQAMCILDRHQERVEGQAKFAVSYIAPEKKERK